MNPLYRNDRQGVLPDSWYAASADIPPLRGALKGQHTADVCIVGAGYTGLSAAKTLAEHGLKVIVLDAHRVGFGASGRNGGQVGSGHNTDQRTLTRQFGETHARALWDIAEEAKADIRENCASHIPEAMYRPGIAHGFYAAKEADDHSREVAFRAKTYGYEQTALLSVNEMRELVKSPLYQGGLLDVGAGHIHPLRYALGLARLAENAGALIHEMSEVHDIAHGDPATVRTNTGRVKARHVIIAGNGYLPHIERKVAAKVMPLNSFICATEPLGDRAQDVLARDIAVEDSKFVVNYFRPSEDGRLLFGGRPSYSIGFPDDMTKALRERMSALFPQLEDVKIDFAWGGALGVTMTRMPAVLRIAPNIFAAGGYSGHGVALSGMAGKVMAEAVIGQAGRFDALAGLNIPSFPGGAALRAPLLGLAMTWYALRDRLGV